MPASVLRLSVVVALGIWPLGCANKPETDRCGEVVLAPHNCDQNGCIGESWSSDKAEFGQACREGEDCQSGLCASDDRVATSYCTQTCDASASIAACPKAAGCFTAEGGLTVCGPPGSAGEGEACP